jgi:hypothetical protein
MNSDIQSPVEKEVTSKLLRSEEVLLVPMNNSRVFSDRGGDTGMEDDETLQDNGAQRPWEKRKTFRRTELRYVLFIHFATFPISETFEDRN